MNQTFKKYELLPVWKQYLFNVLNYLIALFIILGSMSVFNQAIDREYHILPICALLVGVHIVVLPIVLQKQHLIRLTVFSAVWAVYLAIYAIVIPYDASGLVKKFGIMFLLLVFYFYSLHITGNTERVLKYYVNVMMIIALLSLFLWFTASVLKWFHSTGPVLIDWGSERKVFPLAERLLYSWTPIHAKHWHLHRSTDVQPSPLHRPDDRRSPGPLVIHIPMGKDDHSVPYRCHNILDHGLSARHDPLGLRDLLQYL